jgi:hypothetical protein
MLWKYFIFKFATEKPGYKAFKMGTFRIISAYRKLGTPVEGGDFPDEYGMYDSSDELGHWAGVSLDVPGKHFRLACKPELPGGPNGIWLAAAKEAGFSRPFSNELHHYRLVNSNVTAPEDFDEIWEKYLKEPGLQYNYEEASWELVPGDRYYQEYYKEWPKEWDTPLLNKGTSFKQIESGSDRGRVGPPPRINIRAVSGDGLRVDISGGLRGGFSGIGARIPSIYDGSFYGANKTAIDNLSGILGSGEVAAGLRPKMSELLKLSAPGLAFGGFDQKVSSTPFESWSPYVATYDTELSRAQMTTFERIPPAAVPGQPSTSLSAVSGGQAVNDKPKKHGRQSGTTPRGIRRTVSQQRRAVNQDFSAGTIVINAKEIDVESIKRVVGTVGQGAASKQQARQLRGRSLPKVQFPEWRGVEVPSFTRYLQPLIHVAGSRTPIAGWAVRGATRSPVKRPPVFGVGQRRPALDTGLSSIVLAMGGGMGGGLPGDRFDEEDVSHEPTWPEDQINGNEPTELPVDEVKEEILKYLAGVWTTIKDGQDGGAALQEIADGIEIEVSVDAVRSCLKDLVEDGSVILKSDKYFNMNSFINYFNEYCDDVYIEVVKLYIFERTECDVTSIAVILDLRPVHAEMILDHFCVEGNIEGYNLIKIGGCYTPWHTPECGGVVGLIASPCIEEIMLEYQNSDGGRENGGWLAKERLIKLAEMRLACLDWALEYLYRDGKIYISALPKKTGVREISAGTNVFSSSGGPWYKLATGYSPYEVDILAFLKEYFRKIFSVTGLRVKQSELWKEFAYRGIKVEEFIKTDRELVDKVLRQLEKEGVLRYDESTEEWMSTETKLNKEESFNQLKDWLMSEVFIPGVIVRRAYIANTLPGNDELIFRAIEELVGEGLLIYDKKNDSWKVKYQKGDKEVALSNVKEYLAKEIFKIRVTETEDNLLRRGNTDKKELRKALKELEKEQVLYYEKETKLWMSTATKRDRDNSFNNYKNHFKNNVFTLGFKATFKELANEGYYFNPGTYFYNDLVEKALIELETEGVLYHDKQTEKWMSVRTWDDHAYVIAYLKRYLLAYIRELRVEWIEEGELLKRTRTDVDMGKEALKELEYEGVLEYDAYNNAWGLKRRYTVEI